jgi:hypothetical protein
MKPFVISHPRSGLHLFASIVKMELRANWREMGKDEGILSELENSEKNELVFTHNISENFSESTIEKILSSTKTIFLVRCPKDTLFSWIIARDIFSEYDLDRLKRKLLEKYPSAPQYDRIDFWKKNIEGWRKYEDRFLVVRYENLLNHYEQESKRISDYLSLPVKDKLPPVKQVALSRKGIIGDHKRVFDEELINMIDTRCAEEIRYIDKFLCRE